MAAPTITDIASALGIFSATSIATGSTVTATTADSDWLVVFVAHGGAGGHTTSTCSDSAGNVYTQRADIFVDPGCLVVFTAPVTVNITSGTITINFGSSTSVRTVEVYRVRPSVGVVSFVACDTVGANDVSATNHAAPTVSVANGDTIFGVAGIRTNDSITGDSDTTNGNWSTVITRLTGGGDDANSISNVSQYKTATGGGNQSWACTTTSGRSSTRTYLVLHTEGATSSIVAALGQYTLSGTAMAPTLGHVPLTAVAGSYALTGTAATFINSGVTKTIAAEVGSYSLLGTDATLTHGYKLDATTAGSYALTGTDATLRRALPMVADVGVYALTGTDATLTKASITNKVLSLDAGTYTYTGTDAGLRIALKVDATTAGSYALTGSAAALVTAANKVLLAEAGSYALVGTDVTLAITVAPPVVSPLHIGEWPIDKKRRQRREDAAAAEQRARKRFRDAIGRLLEGLPPEFDEPADLDEALDSAVRASNLLYALSAPIREINAVNELIDHIRQLRIARPIAQLHLAQAYNQAHRHLMAKAQEDTVMALLLGE